MTSSSRCAELALVAIVLLGGCVEERVIETQALIVAETRDCDAVIAAHDTVNSYRVMLFEMERASDEFSMCRACLLDGTCALREMVCGCGPSRVPDTLVLNHEVEGLRFPNLRPGREYCLGFVAADVPGLAPRARAEECDCADVTGSGVGAVPRVCGISPLTGRVEENSPAFIIAADCPLDRPCALAAIRPPE